MVLAALAVLAGCDKQEVGPKQAAVSAVAGPPPSSVALRASSAVQPPGATSNTGAPTAASHHTFEAATTLPQEFTPEVGSWSVVVAADAPSGKHVLAQLAKNSGSFFNLLLAAPGPADVVVAVKLRAISGRIDQGGGVVWRARDANNYYIARYNPLEDNFRAYKVVAGERVQIATTNIAIAHDAWHSMKVTMRGDHIRCFIDGALRLAVKDTTFAAAGRVGLWTKADAVTHFDDFTVAGYTK